MNDVFEIKLPESRAQPLTEIVVLLSSILMETFFNPQSSLNINHVLPKYPDILIHDVAGNKPSRPLRPPMPYTYCR